MALCVYEVKKVYFIDITTADCRGIMKAISYIIKKFRWLFYGFMGGQRKTWASIHTSGEGICSIISYISLNRVFIGKIKCRRTKDNDQHCLVACLAVADTKHRTSSLGRISSLVVDNIQNFDTGKNVIAKKYNFKLRIVHVNLNLCNIDFFFFNKA